MSIFSFAKSIGESVFSSTDEPDAARKAMLMNLNNHNPGVENLEVAFDGDTATVTGQAKDQACCEKVALMVGNFKGVANVDVSGVSVPPDAPAEKVEIYEIKSGDTLSKIAKSYYGDAMQYPKIFEANREVIKDPDKIFVGQKIRIPLD